MSNSKYEELLVQANSKLVAEKKVKKTLLATRKEILSEFAKPIYEFMLYVNKNFSTYLYTNGHNKTRNCEVFEFSSYKINPQFSISVANNFTDVEISSHSLNTKISLSCNNQFDISATIGYDNKVHFETSTELIEHLSYLIAKCKIEKK